MATEAEIKALRRDTGTNETSLFTDDANEIFTEAAATYTAETPAYYAHARVLVLQGILASSAKLTTYRQNQSQENLSDVFKHVEKLLKHWQGEVVTAVNDAATGAARASKRLSRIREYPGS